MKKLAAVISISFCLLSPAIGVEQTHEEFTGKVTLDVNYRYLLALPEGYQTDEGRKWPLIVFLHGAGERGTDLETLQKHGPPKLIAAGQKFEAIVASLQCLPQQIWNPHGVKALTDELIKTLRVDAGRVYLTGLSMGGFATWETAIEYPDTYAAIVPICGGAGVRFVMAERIKHLPVWIFHGARDPVVEPSYSKKMFDVLTKVGGNVKLTMYPDAMHDSWTAAYNDPELWKWMFAQKRGGS
jgi:predicted peptidase